jgi:hypothetical protein
MDDYEILHPAWLGHHDYLAPGEVIKISQSWEASWQAAYEQKVTDTRIRAMEIVDDCLGRPHQNYSLLYFEHEAETESDIVDMYSAPGSYSLSISLAVLPVRSPVGHQPLLRVVCNEVLPSPEDVHYLGTDAILDQEGDAWYAQDTFFLSVDPEREDESSDSVDTSVVPILSSYCPEAGPLTLPISISIFRGMKRYTAYPLGTYASLADKFHALSVVNNLLDLTEAAKLIISITAEQNIKTED